ncbi:MAG: LamG domain-containing protein [Sedimentisphaerales bacterium]|nr:LamG domain-containing protein [Sedimentisphaerales bacterium]
MRRLGCWLWVVALAVQAQAGIPEPKGVWEFNQPDPNGATIGAPLEVVGSAQQIAGVNADDGAMTIGQGSYYVCRHGIVPAEGQAKVNRWTLLIDFSYPTSSLTDPPNGYNDLFQTDPNNSDDSDCTINSSGAIGIAATGYTNTSGFVTQGDTWYRMVLVVDSGVRYDLYMDGVRVMTGVPQPIDGRFALADALLLFAAGNQDGDDATIDVSTVAIWDVPLEPQEILPLGRAGDNVLPENVAPIVNAGDDQTVELDETSTAVIELKGAITDDSENLAITWQLVSGQTGVVIDAADSNSATATVTVPGQYIFELSANDGQFTVTDRVAVSAWVHDYKNLIMHWDFEEPWNGQSVNDVSGNLNHGRIIDGQDGTSEYVLLDDGQGLSLLSNDFTVDGDWVARDLVLPASGTIALWMKPINFYNYHSVFDNSGNQDDWEMWIYVDSRARFRVESDTAVTANLNALAQDGNGRDKWWHFACTWARDPNQPGRVTTQLYVNGKLAEQKTGTWIDPGATFFLGGGNPGNDFCNATFSDVRIYDKVLEAREIVGLAYPENGPPRVEAGEEQTVWLSEAGSVTITLSGIVEDFDGSPTGEMTQKWEMIAGPEEVVYGQKKITIETPTARETAVVLTTPGLYVFSFAANDGQFTDTDQVLVDVWPFGDDGLVVHLPLDSNVDEVARGFTTTLIDGADGAHEYVEGIHGQALKLSGTQDMKDNDFVAIDFDYYNRGSICLWFRPTSLYNYNSILDNSCEANDWEMWVYSTGEFAGRIQTGYVRGYYMKAMDWYHIAMTWRVNPDDPDLIEQLLYINGEFVVANQSEWVDPGTTVYLGGGHAGNDDCNGTFDDFRIYDRPLTADEIRKLASRGQ